ncbi:crotonase/enoyl-CoA hydratase family protein [Cohaesibacter gelatinilyticus]|uniref:Enoyl-CoA hydratase n=1 Tax=Cohaesibacter gelatinilyticus TaxID=372072 RepID=A0A285NA99_9HYPH|nr:crotonase/enoyl-CoA hydratase family protein [Cohaesibacter gelatinilyticus]SNZ06395.1 Enoyl-CoA hydratase [Cohaesibacter gelatinilyticus]
MAIACEHIGLEIKDGMRLIRMQRPEKKNALTQPMYQAMAAAISDANSDDDTKVTVLLGEPGAFCAGNDIADFAQMAKGGALGQPIIDLLYALARSEKPIVAGVDGLAIGIGTTMLLHCDYVVASMISRFKTPFTDLALVPEAASSLIAPRLMGHQKAFELLCMSELWDANQMAQTGLINKLVSSEEVEGNALEAANVIASKPQAAMKAARALLRSVSQSEVEAQIEKEATAFRAQLASSEAQAAFAAFLKK